MGENIEGNFTNLSLKWWFQYSWIKIITSANSEGNLYLKNVSFYSYSIKNTHLKSKLKVKRYLSSDTFSISFSKIFCFIRQISDSQPGCRRNIWVSKESEWMLPKNTFIFTLCQFGFCGCLKISFSLFQGAAKHSGS